MPSTSEQRPYESERTSWLLREVAIDARDFIAEQAEYLGKETREAIVESRKALQTAGISGGLFLAGIILFALMVVELLKLAGMSSWLAYGLMGTTLIIGGLIAIGAAKLRAKNVSESTDLGRLKRDAKWIAKKVSSDQN